jgi:hypothetical protein
MEQNMRSSSFAVTLVAAVLFAVPALAAGTGHSHRSSDASHAHKHGKMREAKGAAPGVFLKAFPDTGDGYNLHLLTEGFRFSPEHTGTATDDVEGHAHIYVNGVKKSRIYGPWFHLPSGWLAEGENIVRVTLNDNEHNHWAVHGEPVAAELVLAGTDAFDGTVIERTLGRDDAETIIVTRGANIRLIFHSEAETELHLHGYDLVGVAGPETPAVFAFEAAHTGRFAIVAHDDGSLLGRKEVALAYIEVRSE